MLEYGAKSHIAFRALTEGEVQPLLDVPWLTARPSDDAHSDEVVGPDASAWKRSGEAAEPEHPAGRFGGPRPPIRWGRQLPAVFGLALCLGCLWTLISGGQLPGWQPDWPGARAAAASRS